VRFPSFVDELPLTRRALEFAVARHGDQEREADRAPFILHPLEVAHLLHGRGRPDEVVAAGVLHDTVEDAHVTVEELRTHFGDRVARLVGAVTEPDREGSYSERKAALRTAVEDAEDDAVAIYAADKVAKVRELRMTLAAGGDAPGQKLEHYEASLALLERRLPGHPLVRQLRFELEALELLPPRRASSEKRRTAARSRATAASHKET